MNVRLQRVLVGKNLTMSHRCAKSTPELVRCSVVASNDQYTSSGLPMMFDRGTKPQYLESSERSRLSPMAKNDSSGTTISPRTTCLSSIVAARSSTRVFGSDGKLSRYESSPRSL